MHLNFLIKNSGDSTLKEYSYSKGTLDLTLDVYDLDKLIKISIKTDRLAFEGFYTNHDNDTHKTCWIELMQVSKVLQVENGHYIPSKIFGNYMKEVRANYYLAYGKEATDSLYLFSLVGYSRILSCLVLDIDSIVILDQ